MNKLRTQIFQVPAKEAGPCRLQKDKESGTLVTSYLGSYSSFHYDSLHLVFAKETVTPEPQDWILKIHKRTKARTLAQGVEWSPGYDFYKVWAASSPLPGIWEIPREFILGYVQTQGAQQEVDISIEVAGFGPGATTLLIHPEGPGIADMGRELLAKMSEQRPQFTLLDEDVLLDFFTQAFRLGQQHANIVYHH